MYEFYYKINKEDYWEYIKTYMFTTPSVKKQVNVVRFILPLLFLIAFLIRLFDYEDFTSYAVILVVEIIISVIWFFLVKPFFLLSMKVQIKLMEKDGKYPFGNDTYMSFENDYYIEATEENETKAKYESIDKIITNNNYVYIFISSLQAYIIPNSAFESEEQRESLITFLNNKIQCFK